MSAGPARALREYRRRSPPALTAEVERFVAELDTRDALRLLMYMAQNISGALMGTMEAAGLDTPILAAGKETLDA